MVKKIIQNNALLNSILEWDMKKVVDQVVIENPDIPEEAIRSSELEYKHYVYLNLISGGTLSIPTKLVDLVWHTHILHTRNYIAFCNAVAGEYIHHEPVPFTEENFENNVDVISDISKQVFGNVVFDFNKKNLIQNVSYICQIA